MTRKGWVLFSAMSVIWGVPYLLIKVAVGEVSVPMVVFVRTAVGALVLLPLAMRRIDWGVVRRHWLPILAFSATEMIGPWYLLSDAERTLSSSMTGLLIAAVPIIAALLAILRGERSSRTQWVGLIIGFAGVATLAGPGLDGGSAWAIVEVLLVAVGYSIAPIIAARKLAGLPDVVLAAVSLSIAGIVYLPFAILTWPTHMPSGQALSALAGLSVVCTAFAFLVFFALIREVGPAKAVVFTYVNPVVAVIAGLVVLGETLNALTLVAFALILSGSILATYKRKDRVVA